MPLQKYPKSFELPPTAGLPLCFCDFIKPPALPLKEALQHWLSTSASPTPATQTDALDASFGEMPSPILTCSGTAALIVALKTLQQKQPLKTKIIVPAYTCPLVPLATKLVPGLEMVLCDTMPNSFDFDPKKLASLCNEQILAIVVTHLGGRVANVENAKNIAREHNAWVIEDAAQAMGATFKGKSVGLLGDIGFFSMAVGKGLSTYEGGVLFSKNPHLHADLKDTASKLLQFDFLWSCRRTMELLAYALFYHPSRLWYVYGKTLHRRLDENDEIGAVGDFFSMADIPLHSLDAFRQRVGANAFARLPEYLEQGKQKAKKHIAILKSLNGLQVLEDRPEAEGVWPFIMLLAPTKGQREMILTRLWRSGLGVSKLFIHALPDYYFLKNTLNAPQNSDPIPNSRDFADRLFTISNTHWLNDKSFSLIVQELKKCL